LKVIQLHKKNNQELIYRAAKNDRAAQNTLFEMYAPKMLSICRYYVADVQQAEEVMLNGFFKVFTNLKKFRREGSFEGWMRRIMVREAISFLRTQKNIEFPMDEVDDDSNNFNEMETEIQVADIQQLIDQLPEGYKLVFVMYAVEGYKHKEIAEELSISVGTSKSQLYKARMMLQKKIRTLNMTSYGSK